MNFFRSNQKKFFSQFRKQVREVMKIESFTWLHRRRFTKRLGNKYVVKSLGFKMVEKQKY